MFCTIVLQSAIGKPRTQAVIIYLQENHFLPLSLFSSSERVPLPKFEFLARGVYLVPPLLFPTKLRHCGTLKVVAPYHKRLRHFPCRQSRLNPDCPGLLFRQARSLRASQHRASMDFPLLNKQRLPECY